MTFEPLLIRGDARALPLPDASVDLIVTSPPYFGLRDYGTPGQLGTEPTPAQFIAALIECTREMMRVLKPSGSIFVNLGDRFSGGDRFDNEFTVEDAAWLGGVVDSDGSISIHRTTGSTSYTAWVRVGQMRREVVERIASVTGVGKVFQDRRGVWNWNAAAQQAAWVLRRIWPWLHIKRQQALAAVELQSRKAAVGGKGRWNALTDAELQHRERIRRAVLAWNRGDVDDYAAPLLALPDLPLHARRIPQKSLSLLPERYRVACVDELGLIARAVIIWSKSNGLPESVTDRVRRSHEDWVHLTKSPRYFSAVDEIREPHAPPSGGRGARIGRAYLDRQNDGGGNAGNAAPPNPRGKLPGSVWTIPTQPLRVPAELGVDHFAAFPMEWPRRIIQGWCPAEVCAACGEGRRPVVSKPDPNGVVVKTNDGQVEVRPRLGATSWLGMSRAKRDAWRAENPVTITAYACACPDVSAPSTPGVVLDPFGGTGTTAVVAAALGRRGISVDLNPDYCRLAAWRSADPKQRAKAAGGNPKPRRAAPAPIVPTTQFHLFDGEGA